MVAGLSDANSKQPDEPSNRVVRVLMRRHGMSQTFGENMIFMLNRASEFDASPRTPQVSPTHIRTYTRGFMHAVADPETPLRLIHDERDVGILLHQRPLRASGRLH